MRIRFSVLAVVAHGCADSLATISARYPEVRAARAGGVRAVQVASACCYLRRPIWATTKNRITKAVTQPLPPCWKRSRVAAIRNIQPSNEQIPRMAILRTTF